MSSERHERVRRPAAAGFWGALGTDYRLRSLVALAVVGITFAAFVPALHNGYAWDDDAYLQENEGYHGLGWEQLRWMFTTFHAGHYMPLTWVSWGLDYLIWGEDPVGYHLGNVVLHALNALLFLLLADRLLALAMPASNGGHRFLGAALAAVIFGVHPLRVESVAWATERKDCLSGLFYLLTLLWYLRAAGCPPGRRRRWLLLATGFVYALALLSKVMSVSVPPVMLALDVYPLRRLGTTRVGWLGPSARRVWIEKVPFLLMAAAVAAPAPFAAAHAETLGSLGEFGFADRVAISLYSLAFYLPKMLVPLGLSTLYEMPVDVNPLSLKYVASGAVVVLVTAVLILARRRWPAGLAAWWCYGVILLPVMGIVQIGPQIAADRYTYLSCLGWALLIGAGVMRVWQAAAGWQRIALSVSCVAALLALLGLTWRQCGFWHSQLTLWSRAVEVDDDCSVCHYNLGTVLIHEGREEEAIGQFREALRVDPESARAACNWGVALSELGRWDEAEERFHAALRIDPEYANAYVNLAALMNRQGRLEEAIRYYERGLDLDPDNADALQALGSALSTAGRLAEAAERFRQAVRIAPNNADTRIALAGVLSKLGQADEAVRQLEYAIRIDPRRVEAYNNLGNVLAATGRAQRAVAVYREAIRVDPTSSAAYCNLANALSRMGKGDEAAGFYREALRVDPDFAEAHNNFANLLVRQRKIGEAVAHYQSAIRVDPEFGEAYYNLGVVLTQQRRYAEAVAVLRRGREVASTNVNIATNLAWLLATCPDDELRDGPLAVSLAEAAVSTTRSGDAQALSALAAAYAEVGRYVEAAQTAERARVLAESKGQARLAEAIAARRDVYSSGRPYRLPSQGD